MAILLTILMKIIAMENHVEDIKNENELQDHEATGDQQDKTKIKEFSSIDENSRSQADDLNTNEAQEELVEKSELDVLHEELQASKDKYLRLFAEFENYKKRTTKERLELFKTAGQEVIQALLPVLDDFDRALKELSKSGDTQAHKGMSLISAKLNETLKNKGLEVMYVNVGADFDADLHEAITQIPAPSDDLKGKIIDVVELGYTLGEKIIRYPKVVTGK